MIEEGDSAVPFELPAVVDGEFEQVALEEYLGKEVIILAFYPADFNPACEGGTTDLDELDLFTMQKDVSILGISADSIYSHRAFADEFDLHIPLLSDAGGRVADAYGVAKEADDEGYLTRRAIVVIDHSETVEYAWVAEDIGELPDVEAIRDTVEGVGSDETAEARYTVGHAHYIEGRRAFTSAMKAYEDKEWMMSQGDFDRAYEEFGEAKEEFNTAVRFCETEENETYFRRAEDKAEALWRASEWLMESANAFSSGEGAQAESMRKDAEAPLEEARAIHDPVEPDGFPPEEDPADETADDDEDEEAFLPEEKEEVDTTLELDESAVDDEDESTDKGEADSEDEDAGEIDDDELEEIAAELEGQDEDQQEDDGDEGEIDFGMDPAGPEEIEDAPQEETAEDEGEIELDLTDPTEGQEESDDDEGAEDEEEDESAEDDPVVDEDDLGGSGGHGVPDSL